MSETYKRVNDRRVSSKGAESTTETVTSTLNADFFKRVLLRPLHMLGTEIIVLLLDLYIAVNFGLLNGFFAAFPYVFETQYEFRVQEVGLTFLGQAVGSLLGASAAVVLCCACRACSAELPLESKGCKCSTGTTPALRLCRRSMSGSFSFPFWMDC